MTWWRALWAVTWVPVLACAAYGITLALMWWGWTGFVYVLLSLSSVGLGAAAWWPTRVIASEDSGPATFCYLFSVLAAFLATWALPALVFRTTGTIENCHVVLGQVVPRSVLADGTTSGPTQLYQALCPSGLRPDVEPVGGATPGEPMRIAFLHSDSLWALPIDLTELHVVEWATLIATVLAILASLTAVITHACRRVQDRSGVAWAHRR